MGAKFLAVLEGRKRASVFEMKASLSEAEEERAASPVSKQASTGNEEAAVSGEGNARTIWLFPDGGGEERRRKRSKQRRWKRCPKSGAAATCPTAVLTPLDEFSQPPERLP